jgi:hypothetical protein
MHRALSLAIATAISLAASSLSACSRGEAVSTPEPPARVVRAFYDTRLRLAVDGAPSAEQLAALAPLVSDTLRALLDSARRLRDAEAARAPDEKPPFVEGDLFSSLFEGPTAFTVDTAALGPRVPVHLTRADDSGRSEWTDRVVVREERGRWVVDDVEYGGTWQFANKGTLRASLLGGLR